MTNHPDASADVPAEKQLVQLAKQAGERARPVGLAIGRFAKRHPRIAALVALVVVWRLGLLGLVLHLVGGLTGLAIPALIVGVVLVGVWEGRKERQHKVNHNIGRTIKGTIGHEPLFKMAVPFPVFSYAAYGLELVFHGLSSLLTPADQRGKVKPLEPPKKVQRYLIEHKDDAILVHMPHDAIRDAHNEPLMATLSKALGSVLKHPVRLAWEFGSATLIIRETVEIPRWVPNTPADLIPLEQRHLIPLGMMAHGKPVYWNLTSDNPHLLPVGPTGAGKTGLVRTVATQSALRGHDVRLVDVKTELEPFADFPGVTEFASEPKDVERVIHSVYQEMKRRQQTHDQGQHIVLVVEEYAELIRVAPKLNGRQQAVEDVQSIAALGRKHNVHLVVATQRPDSKLIGGSFRDNLGFRVGFAGLSPDGWEMVTGQRADPGIEDAPGRGLLVHGRNRAGTEFQAAYTGDPDDRRERNQPELVTILDDLWEAAGAQRVSAEEVEQSPEDADAVDAALRVSRMEVVNKAEGQGAAEQGDAAEGEAPEAPMPGTPGGPCLALVVTKPDGSTYSPWTVAFWPKGKRCEHVGCQQLRRQRAREESARRREREADGSRAKRVNPTRAMKSELGTECVVCGSTEQIEYDHVDGDRTNTTVENLVPLCHEHHVAKTHGRL